MDTEVPEAQLLKANATEAIRIEVDPNFMPTYSQFFTDMDEKSVGIKERAIPYDIDVKKAGAFSQAIVAAFLASVFLSFPLPASAAQSSASLSNGSTMSISSKSFISGTKVMVTGKNFDETVGIYLAFCVMPQKGQLPSPCGGGVNKSGVGESSYWISSNPPPYGVGVATPYLPGGRFAQQVRITRKIGKFDCAKVKCAITVRSDHLHEGDRTHDLYIPITILTKKP